MYQLPRHLHDIARFEGRRAQLAETARIELLVARILTTVRRADIAMAVTAAYHGRAAQPKMVAWTTEVIGYRTQPRDGRGRFLSRAWLLAAESYLPVDLAWFARPVTSTMEG